MSLKEMIFKRKSVRSFVNAPIGPKTIAMIEKFISEIKPLYPDIKVKAEIVDRDAVKCICPWTTKQLVAVFTEDKPGAMENVGFMFQQLDLYLHSLGLGSCWLGMGKMDARAAKTPEGLRFVMLLAFGYPKEPVLRTDKREFKRKSLLQISDREDPRLEPARLAPSSVNSQPWYFVHEDETIHIYCAMRGLVSKTALGDMNRIDIGIALAHLFVSNPDSFRFFRQESAPEVKHYLYLGSFRF